MVFIDIVDSTKLKQDLGDIKGVHLIESHHRLVANLAATCGEGKVVKKTGDGCFLSFATPSDAVAFALRLQVRLRQFSQEAGRFVQDRTGIHAGEILQHTEEGTQEADLHGIQVDASSRIMSLAGPGQILLTRVVYDNARQILGEELIPDTGCPGWAVHGLYEFKGIREPVEVCEVVVAGRREPRAPADSEKARRVVEAATSGLDSRAIARRSYRRRLREATAGERRGAWAGALLATVCGLVFLFTGWVDVLSFDLSHGLRQWASAARYSNDVEIVVMDDESLSLLHQSYLREWDRRLHARLLNHLSAARAVVFDIVFQTNRPAEDPAFLLAIREHGRVAVACDLQERVENGYATIVPVAPFAQLATNAWCGLTESAQPENLAIRRPRYGQPRPATIWPWQSLAEELVRRIDAQPKSSPIGAWMNYYCPPNRIPVRSFWQVLSNDIPSSVFSNKVVFVGSKIERRNPDEVGSDHFKTPYNLWGFPDVLGVVANATSYLNLKRCDWYFRLPPWVEFLGIVLLGIASGYLLYFLPPAGACVGGLTAIVVVALVLALQLVLTRIWFPCLVVVLGQVPVAVFWSAWMNGRSAGFPPAQKT